MKTKRIGVILAVLALLLISAAEIPSKLVRLTIVNKSGMDIEVSLNGKDFEQFYYLKVAEGSRMLPTEQTFTVTPDEYQVDAYFVELWDPVYGASCEDRQASVDMTHNTRLIVFECDTTPPNAGEAPKIKLGGSHRRR